MKCEDRHELIQEYVDGELAGRRARSIAEHLMACKSCAALAGELKREQEIYALYQREVEVSPALWAGVQERIGRERLAPKPGVLAGLREWLNGPAKAPRLSPAFVAAMVVLAIGLTVVITTYVISHRQPAQISHIDPPPSPTPGETHAAVDGVAEKQPEPQGGPTDRQPVTVRNIVPRRVEISRQAAAQQLIKEAEQKYVTAIAMLTRDFNKRRATMDPTVLARFDGVLKQIDLTIAETKKAYRQNSQDPTALQYLLAAYSKKVEVLRDVTLN